MDGERRYPFGTPEYQEMINSFVKKPRSDQRSDVRHGFNSGGIYRGDELKEFLKNIDVPDSINYEVAPRGCQHCLLRCFGMMEGTKDENWLLDPSKFFARQSINFSNSLPLGHPDAYWPATEADLAAFATLYPDGGSLEDWENRYRADDHRSDAADSASASDRSDSSGSQ